MSVILKDVWNCIQFLFENLLFVNILLSIIVVFFQRKEPKSTWAWLLILYAIPIVGFIIYLLAGTDIHKSKMFRTKEIEDQLQEAIRQQEYSIRNKEMENTYPDITGYSDLIYYNLESAGAVLTDDNDIQVYTDGHKKFQALIEDIKNAKQSIHMQYYIIKNDQVFGAIKEVLIQKAKEGVEVRLLFDAMGCRSVKKSYWKKLTREGVQIAVFFPAMFKRLHLRVNYRNHRKIVVIDGKIGYVGGFNVAKEYLGLDPKFGYWRDTHMRFEGSAAFQLQVRFVLDWNYVTRENLFSRNVYFVLPEGRPGNCEAQIISSGPDSALQNIRNNYLRLICKAEKSIYIQTPYFIPDESLLNALIVAVYSGVEVNVMIPCKPDHLFVYWATYSYIGDLVAAGARCFTYDNGFLHAKGMIVDSKVCCYGTANMDIRSFQLNFEVNAIIYNENFSKKMEDIFKEDLKLSTQITKELYGKRSLLIRLKEQFSRLLSPLL